MSKADKHFYEFGPYALIPAERQLRHGDTVVALEPKVFDTLLALVERGGELASKEELLRRIWPDTYVEEINLARNISILRKVLALGFAGEPCIQTVPKHGYRFVAPVRAYAAPAGQIVIEQTTTSLIYEEDIELPETRPALPPAHPSPGLRVAAMGLTVILCLAGWLGWQQVQHGGTATAALPLRSLAVLPFRSLDAAGREPFLEIGVADTLITRLSNLGELTVRPTSAVRVYAESNTDALSAGRALKVDAVLEGSLQRSEDRLRVTVRLLRVRDGQSLWAYQCDTACSEIFQTQDTVSLRVAAALRSHLSNAEQQLLTKRGTRDAEAYRLRLKGQYFFNQRTAESFRKAIDAYQQALARDPNYALAHHGLAQAQRWLREVSGQPGGDYRAHLQKAAELDPALPEVHALLGLLAQNEDWDWATAEREFQEAIARNPNYATAHQWYGEHLFLMGRYDEGLRELRRALEIDPLSLIINSDLAKCYYFARRFDEAIAQARRTLELDPQFIEPHYWLGHIFYQQGRYAEALAETEKVLGKDQRLFTLAMSGTIFARQGRRGEAERVLAELRTIARQRRVEHEFFARIFQAQGETELALEALEKSYAAHEVSMTSLQAPLWDSMRQHPRFQALLRRLHFPSLS